MESNRVPSAEPRLRLRDAVSLIVGIIIGVGIFETPHLVFDKAPSPWAALSVWALGGVLAMLGAFCFAELASTYPRSGGEYVYLTRSFGSLTGYLFAWAQLTVIRPGGIGAMAYVFALYADQALGFNNNTVLLFAVASVIAFTMVNVLGVMLGTRTQNLLTILKVVGVGGIIAVGLGWGQLRSEETRPTIAEEGNWFAGAMFLVLWTYAGWHEAGYVAAEVRNNRRNLPLALFLGTGLVTVIYLLVNLAYWLAVGFEDARLKGLAMRVLALAWGDWAATVMAILVMLSALGALNGMIFTTARLTAAFGADHRLFDPLGRWSARWKTPAIALLVEGAIAVVILVTVNLLGEGQPGLEALIGVTNGVFWFFFLATGASVFMLRKKDRDLPRPFRVPGYPIVPLIFCLWCAYMTYASVDSWYSLLGLAVLTAGLPFYFIPKKLAVHHNAGIEERTTAAV